MPLAAHTFAGLPVAFWRGQPPDFAKQRVTSHTRPGANGVGRVVVGKSGRPFSAELEFHTSNYTAALNLVPVLMNFTGRPPVRITYNYRRLWLAPFLHNFYVDDVVLLQSQRVPRLTRAGSGGYDYAGGAVVVVGVTLTPFPLF